MSRSRWHSSDCHLLQAQMWRWVSLNASREHWDLQHALALEGKWPPSAEAWAKVKGTVCTWARLVAPRSINGRITEHSHAPDSGGQTLQIAPNLLFFPSPLFDPDKPNSRIGKRHVAIAVWLWRKLHQCQTKSNRAAILQGVSDMSRRSGSNVIFRFKFPSTHSSSVTESQVFKSSKETGNQIKSNILIK